MACHGHVYEVGVAQVNFRHASCSLHDDGVVELGESVEGGVYGCAQLCAALLAEVVVGGAVAYGAAVEHHLRGVFRVGFQQQGVHVGRARHAACLGLYSLRTSYLQSVWRGVRVECHVLRLEGCGAVSLLQEDAAEGCGEYALAHVAARADEHYGV